jgi:alpha-1,3-rhamnosyl/mannosyltransferase
LLASDVADQASNLGLKQQVQFLPGINNDDLVKLYNAASLFVFPSREEGFGLPLLEAMSCGTPVVAANNSSIPEIAGDAAVLVDAEDAPGMAAAIERVVTDESLRCQLRQTGLARSAGFSWKRCAAATLVVYRQVAA